MKQTAVEWLVEQICGHHTEQWQKEIQQAKEMEKEQIVKAIIDTIVGSNDIFDKCPSIVIDTAEQYYHDTFK